MLPSTQFHHVQISSKSASLGACGPDPVCFRSPESRNPFPEPIMDETTSTNGDTSRQSDPSAISTDQGFITGDSLTSADFDLSNAHPGSSTSNTNASSSNIAIKKDYSNTGYSPAVFKTPTNKVRVEARSSQIDWSIEHKSTLFPANIDESFYYDSPVNNDKSLQLRQEVDKFWRNSSQIAPSPMVMLPNHVKGPSFTPSPATPSLIMTRRTSMKMSMTSELRGTPVSRSKSIFLEVNERECQTDISIPTDVDFDFAAVVQQAMQRRRIASTPQKKTPEERILRVHSPDASIIHHSPRNLFGDDYSFEGGNDCFVAEIEDHTFSTSPVSIQQSKVSFRGDVGTEVVGELLSFDSFGLPPMSPIGESLSESFIPASPPPSAEQLASPSRAGSIYQSPPQATSSFSNSGMPEGHDHLETISED
uniref:Protein aurora borealis n=1 Tax=Panagrellus redivivus TaxID=6233 RepID=A0A7E4W7V5_PANRE